MTIENPRLAPHGTYNFLRESAAHRRSIYDKKNCAQVTIEEEPVCEIGGACLDVEVEKRVGMYKRKVRLDAHISKDDQVVRAHRVDWNGIHDATSTDLENLIRTARALIEKAKNSPNPDTYYHYRRYRRGSRGY